MQNSTVNERITVVDSLRGFALFGLFIVHMVEYFELFWHAPEWGWVHDTVFFLFGGKAYAVFSLLFGLSFFIIMDNRARRRVDFRGRFARRLLILLALGYLHGLLYSGDILQVLAVSGLLLMLVYPLSNRLVLVLAAVCLAQPVLLARLVLAAGGAPAGGDPLHWSLMGETFEIYATGSFAEVVQRNVLMGQAGKWLFMIESGRIWNVAGLFLVGFVLGRVQFFRQYREKLRFLVAALACGILLLLALHYLQTQLAGSDLSESVIGAASTLLNQYFNNLMTATGVVLFLLAWEVRWLQLPMGWLAPCGRMSLTIYVTQSLYGVPMFYGFGLGLYQGFGQVNALLLGLALWAVQVLLASLWMKRYYYGPFEWAWRAATYGTVNLPWRRQGGAS